MQSLHVFCNVPCFLKLWPASKLEPWLVKERLYAPDESTIIPNAVLD
jgi:hypothetical protein